MEDYNREYAFESMYILYYFCEYMKGTNITLLCLSLVCITACKSDFDRRLTQEAKDYTLNHCPQSIDEGTTLDSVTYSPESRTYTFWYTLNSEYEDFVKENPDAFRNAIKEELVSNVTYVSLKDKKVTFGYRYHSLSTHKEIFKAEIKAEEYQR